MKKKSIIVLEIVIMLVASTITVSAIENQPPSAPGISGPTSVKKGESHNYQLTSVDPEGDQIFYLYIFGSVNSGWIGPYESGYTLGISISFQEEGVFELKAKAKDINENESPLSVLQISCTKPKCLPSNSEPAEEEILEQPLNDEPLDDPDPADSTCFLIDTKIVMYDPSVSLASDQVFYKNIQEIRIGDKVISLNPDTGELTYSTVTEVYHHTADEMTDGYLIINRMLRITFYHPVFVDNKYIPAGELKIGDVIFGVTITSIEFVSAQEDSYNIMVEPYNNFLVPIGNTQSNIIPVEYYGFIVEPIIVIPPVAPSIAPGFGLFGDKNNLVESTISQPAQTTTEINTDSMQTGSMEMETSETMTVEMETIETETTGTGNLLV